MDFYTRARAVGGAAKMSNKKDVKIAFAKRDFATHFKDSVDYEDNTLVNGLPQKLVVSRSNSIAKEKKIWAALEIDPTNNPNYIESGQGMGATITMADEEEAYTLTDRGTWLKFKNDSDLDIELNIVCEGAKDLLNQYGVIAVNPEMFEGLNNEAANVFIDWICSEKVQELIGQFGVEEYGQALFTPDAGTDN